MYFSAGVYCKKSNQINLYLNIGWFLRTGKNWSTRRKISQSRIENLQGPGGSQSSFNFIHSPVLKANLRPKVSFYEVRILSVLVKQ